MKNLVKSSTLLLLLLAVPIFTGTAQDSKTEKKVKVVINDGSGATTIVDTVFTNGPLPDSIVSKDGKVIYFNTSETGNKLDGKHKTVTVMMSSDGDKMEKEEKTIIVTGGEPVYSVRTEGEGKGKIYAYSTASPGSGERVITIIDGKDGDKTEAQTWRVVNSGKPEAENDMARYVVARNGVVVTVECNDEAKAREILKAVESKLGAEKSAAEPGKNDKSDKK